MLRYRRFIMLFIALFAIASMMLAPKPAQAAGTVVTCSHGALMTALSGGGSVDFAIGAPCTITFPGPWTVSTSTTVNNTSGFNVTFDGGGTAQIFIVDASRTLTISNIIIQNGYMAGNGGAIRVNGTLNAANMVFDNNVATGRGGGNCLAGGAGQYLE